MSDRDPMPLRVTAIIPTCRRPALLARALRSIAAQREQCGRNVRHLWGIDEYGELV